MIKRNNKKGFTIVELVIVIAVIAILAAVLIPTFAGIIKKANLSADMQAVRQMNSALVADGAVTPTDIFELHEVLAENGMTSEDYHPLTNDTFFWDADLNRVLHVDKNMAVITPEEYAGQVYKAGTSKWISLSLSIEAAKPDGFKKDDAAVTVKNGAELLYVLDAVADKKTNANLTINIPNGGIDMMGAAFDIPVLETNLTIVSADANNPATIYNATAVDATYMGQGKTQSDMGQYNTSLFPKVNATLTVENVVFENINMKNTHSSNVGIIAGSVSGSVKIDNVTIKNSTVIGHRNVGALIGNVQSTATATIGNVTMENVSVKTVGGRSGMLVGVMGATNGVYGTLNVEGSITLKNCSLEMYKCEQNTAAGYGLDETTKVIKSWCIESNGSKGDRNYTFDSTALVMKDIETGKIANELFGDKVDGWN